MINYSSCKQRIAQEISATPEEYVPLEAALARIPTNDISARFPQPEYRQSLRDGFVLGPHDTRSPQLLEFKITGVIPAGSLEKLVLGEGEACRIMTGGMVPATGVRVIAQEDCNAENSVLQVPQQALRNPNSYIQEQGADIAEGQTVVEAGTVINPEHLGLLASVGCQELGVSSKPRVGFFCSGSELVESSSSLQLGQKVSSNRNLLEGLLIHYGAMPVYLGTIGDTEDALEALFQQLRDESFEMVISTGGMGPGKYDLIESTFRASGGKVFYSKLDLRPGKDSLFGRLNTTLFFGLPGPPTAVHILMNAIVGPALLTMQGVKGNFPQTMEAHLQQSLSIKQPGVMQLRGGVHYFDGGRCLARQAKRLEPSTCLLMIPADRTGYESDELITIQLISPQFGYNPTT